VAEEQQAGDMWRAGENRAAKAEREAAAAAKKRPPGGLH